MEKIFFVKNNDLREVNEALKEGARVKMIQTVSEVVSQGGSYKTAEGEVYAYVVVENYRES